MAAKLHFDEATDVAKALKMCDGAISEHQSSRQNSTSVSAMLISRRDRAYDQLKDYHVKLIKKIQDHQRYFDKKLNDLLIERQQECSRIISGVDERAVRLRELKSQVECFEQEMTTSGPTETLFAKLKQAVDEIAALKQENDKVAAAEALQRLLDMEFEYLPQSDVVSQVFDANDSILYLNSCGIKPQELQLEAGSPKFAVHQRNKVFVKCPNRNLTLLYHIRVEALNLNKNTVERLSFQMFYPNCSMAFEFSPSECCQYRLSCFLYDVPIANSPTVVEGVLSSVDVNTLSDQLLSNMNFPSIGRGTVMSSDIVNGCLKSQESNVGVGRGYPGTVSTGGRSRIMENILRAPIVSVAKRPTYASSAAVDSEADADQFQDVKNNLCETDVLNTSVSSTTSTQSVNGSGRRYMGRLLDANDETIDSHHKPKCHSNDEAAGKLKVGRNTHSNERNDVISHDARSYDETVPSNEDWDAETTSVAGGSFKEASLDVSPMEMTYKRRVRPDLTHLIKRGRGIGAKLILNLGQFGKSDPVEAYFNMPIGCASNDVLGQYLVCDTRHNAVKLYDLEGHTKLMIDGERNPDLKLSGPSAISVVENNNFVVKDNSKFYKFSPDGQLLSIYGAGLFKKVYGLAQDSRGVLMTLDLGQRREAPILFGIDSCTGKTLMQTEFAASRNVRNSKCYFMDCVDETFVVTDLGASQAYICDPSGGLKLCFGEMERSRAEPGKFNEPSGVTMDAAANIFIGDSRNDRVQIWSSSGEYLGDVLFSNRIFRPSNIYLTADGHLIVMNYIKHFVSIFKLEALPS